MKRTLQNRLLRTTILGLIAVTPTYALAGDAQYYFPKDNAGKPSDKSETEKSSNSANIDKSTGDKFGKDSATNGSVATKQNSKLNGSAGFRPDFDGTGGRGPAMAPIEGKKNPDDEGYYVKTRGYRLEPEPDIPPYVRNLAKTYSEFKDIDWLNVGLDSRTRYEYRENSYVPRANTTGIGDAAQRQYYPYTPWLVRTRGYVGVKDIFDPFRFVIEFQDSRAFNSLYQLQGQDINETELLQGYGELYLKDALGTDAKGQGRAISIRAGRMKFEVGSRRLIASNEFRNTTNNFEGFRLRLGERYNDVDLDSFLMRPVIRYPYAFDQPEWNNWIYGSFLSVRNVSPYFTIQPYLIGRKQYGDPLNPSAALKVKRDTQAPGLRVYGNYKNFDWDLDVMKQFGTVGTISSTYPYIWAYNNISNPFGGYAQTKQHDAIAYGFDVGYTFAEHPWKPRISAVYIYGSGNSSPWSSTNNNVDTFYGFNQPFSRNDYIGWNNVKDPKVRVEFEPVKDTRIDTAFSAYWLASSAAAWDRANLYAPLGNRGTFMGTEWDIRVRQKVSEFLNISASYARFWPGSFASSFAPPTAQQWPPVNFPGGTVAGQTTTTNGLTARPTNFFYLEATLNAFGDGKPIAKLPGSDFMASWEPNAPEQKTPSWTDVYIGLNGGGAWSSPTITSQEIGWAGLTNSSRAGLGNNSIGVANSTLTPLPTTFTNKIGGFVGGFQVGANYKLASSFVTGAEADLDGTAGNTNSKWTIGSARGGVNSNNLTNTYTTYSQHTTTLSYLGTIRGRLGYLIIPTLQVYGTGGFAYGGVTAANANVTARTGGTNFFYSGPQFNGTLLGWAAGGGLEWMFTKDWSVKADYLYYNLGSVSLADNYYSVTYAPYVPSTNYTNNGNAFGVTGLATANFSGNVIRAGVNRHFDLVKADAVTK
jgi:opacity protein-like surface antigen